MQVDNQNGVISYKIKGLSDGSQMEIAYNAVAEGDDSTYHEFLNQSSVNVEAVKKDSNYVRHYFASDSAAKHTLDFEYKAEEGQPTSPPSLPSQRQQTENDKIVLPQPTMPGYTFDGWSYNGSPISGDTYTMPAEAVTLVGSWIKNAGTPVTKTVTYKYDSSAPEGAYLPDPKTYIVGTSDGGVETITGALGRIPGIPPVEGYEFKGFASQDLTAEELALGVFNVTKDITLTGSWEKNSFKVEYMHVGNGPQDAPALPTATDVQWGESVTVADKLGDVNDYRFDGWYTDNNVAIDEHNTFTMPQEDIILYAYYRDKPKTITYQFQGERPAGVDDTFKTQEVSGGSLFEIADGPGPVYVEGEDDTRGVWQFTRWDVTSLAEGVKAGTYIMPDNDITVMGAWQFTENPKVKVTFQLENGTWKDEMAGNKEVLVELKKGKGTLDSNDVPTVADMVADTGYTVGGWIVAPNTTKDGITGDVIYTYKFVPIPENPGVVPAPPDTPDTPEDPDTPDIPDTPEEPDKPDDPNNPGKPDNPDTPNKPNTPDEPSQKPGTPENPTDPENPQTGDKNNLAGLLGLLGISIVGLAVVIIKRKKSGI